MDFGFNDDQEMLRSSTRQLLEKECPIEKVRTLFDDPVGFDRDVWQRGAELGWYSMLIPEGSSGGSLTGQGLVDLLVVAEEFGRLVQPAPYLVTNVVAFAIATFGTEDQKLALLPSLASGERIASWCVAEESGSWDPADISCSIEPGHAGLTLSGTKLYVESAHVADTFLVTGRCGGELVQILVPARTPGIAIKPMVTLDPTRRLSEVVLDGVLVPHDAMLGEPSADEDVRRLLQVATVLKCADSIGGADRVVEFTVQYLKDRVQFGRPIGSFQANKHKAANLLMWLEAARAATYNAGLAVADATPDRAEAVSIAGSYVGDAYAQITSEALQLHGGIGFTWEHDLHLYIRRAKTNCVLFGDPYSHREHLWRELRTSRSHERS